MSTVDFIVEFIANPSRNWTFLRFARVAEEERTQRNKLKISHSLGFEPRSFDYNSCFVLVTIVYHFEEGL